MFLIIVFLSVIFGLLTAWPAMILWNLCLLPALAKGHLQPVTWLQMWGICVLCNILFKSNITQKTND
jgi:hypothetical protein